MVESCIRVNDTQETLSMSTEISDIKTKFSELIESLGFTSIQNFASRAGIHHQTIRSQLDSGRLSHDVLSKISEFGGDVNWLLTGRGRMLLSERGGVRDISIGGQYDTTDLLMIPLYGVRAGAGEAHVVISEQPEKMLAFREDWIRAELRRNPANLFLITVDGDSMYPTMVSGEVVLVDKSETRVSTDAIYLLQMGGGIIVKRLQWLPDGRLRILSDNPAFSHHEVGQEELSNGIQVLGRVVWGGRRY